MPVRQRWDEELRTLFVTLSGPVSDQEFVDFATELVGRNDIPPAHMEFIDLSELKRTDVEATSLREAATTFRGLDTTVFETRVAILATSDVAFGLARMYQSFRGDSTVEFEVFRDRAAALEWLGLPEDTTGA
jgi:hypothetical protein